MYMQRNTNVVFDLNAHKSVHCLLFYHVYIQYLFVVEINVIKCQCHEIGTNSEITHKTVTQDFARVLNLHIIYKYQAYF